MRYYISTTMKHERVSLESGVPAVPSKEEKYPPAIRAAIIIGASVVLWGLIGLLIYLI